ncbi:MAG: molybdenum cofactor carrier [Gammaproteobacteria bacterium]|nr:molybdenum cofactor carrier [Gammaproteobacteria bacterium]
MIEKIISGGQTGVDRAALDAALGFGIPCGGWCPRGRRAEDGTIPARYPLIETERAEYEMRTRRNVRDADATLILSVGAPEGGTELTRAFAEALGRPVRVVDLGADPEPEAVQAWLRRHRVRVLNVAGPRASKHPGVYARARRFLERVLASQPARGA